MPTNRPSSKFPRGATRDRILDVALDLFNEQGYDKTSLREIAEKLGFTKAALYYHFARKEDILLALHYRMHDLGRDAVDQLGRVDLSADDPTPSWLAVLDHLIEEVIANRKLFILHARNHGAMEDLHHREDYKSDHEAMGIDAEEQMRRLLADPRMPLGLRVRMACSLGAVLGTLLGAADVFRDLSDAELVEEVRGAVRQLFA